MFLRRPRCLISTIRSERGHFVLNGKETTAQEFDQDISRNSEKNSKSAKGEGIGILTG